MKEDLLLNAIKDTAFKLLLLAETELPDDVLEALRRARDKETNELARKQLEAMIENVKYAQKHRIPICQDTGIPIFYAAVGEHFPVVKVRIPRLIREAVVDATQTIPLRPNATDPFTGVNTGDNTGYYIPYVNCVCSCVCPGNELVLTTMPKGGGSENMSALRMITPGEGVLGVKKVVLDTVFTSLGKPCPPIIIGVGLGGGADIAMSLAKKALLRPLTERHENPEVARLEEELLEAVNKMGVGPMGLGGRTTALGLNIEYAHRHIASYPVGILVQCWAARRASARISADGRVEFLTHKVGV